MPKMKPEPFRTVRERRQFTLDEIKHEIFFFEEGVTTEAEYLRAIIFKASNRLNIIGENTP